MYPLEKDSLLPAPALVCKTTQRKLGFCFLLAAICAGIALYTLGPQRLSEHFESYDEVALKEELCPQEGPLLPTKSGELWKELGETYSSKDFLHEAIESLGGAIRIP